MHLILCSDRDDLAWGALNYGRDASCNMTAVGKSMRLIRRKKKSISILWWWSLCIRALKYLKCFELHNWSLQGGKHNYINRLSANSTECVCLVLREPPWIYINKAALRLQWWYFCNRAESHLVTDLGCQVNVLESVLVERANVYLQFFWSLSLWERSHRLLSQIIVVLEWKWVHNVEDMSLQHNCTSQGIYYLLEI